MTAALQGREALQARAEALQRERGAALLDGRKFDNAAVESARASLEAIDDAEAEQHRRQAAAATKAEAERQATARARIAELDKARLAAIAGAEKVAREMVEKLREAEAARAEMNTALASIGVVPPLQLARSEVARRLSRQLAFLLARPPEWEWGEISWGSLPDDLGGDWSEAERAATAAAIAEFAKEP